MKREMSELNNEIVVVDTNVFINFEHKKCSDIDLKAINNIFKTDIKPFVTSLSFCEMVVGSRSLDDFKIHYKEFVDMEFLLCGNDDDLSNFLSRKKYNLINSNNSFNKFKKEIIELRNKILFPMFYSLAILYIKTSIMVFHKIDKHYWDAAFFLFNDILLNRKKEFSNLLFDLYKSFVDDKTESKKLISGLFTGLIVNLLTTLEPNKYNEFEIETKIKEALIPKNYSSLIQELGVKKDPNFLHWLEKGYIAKTRKLIDSNDEFPILSDGICFINSQIILHGANYDTHDLIDLYNIYFVSIQNNRTHYFTNDTKKWSAFVEIEKVLRPTINIYFNK